MRTSISQLVRDRGKDTLPFDFRGKSTLTAYVCRLLRNEPVLDFVMAIEEHARVRGMSHDDAWWVW